MANILAIDTVSDACSVAVCVQGEIASRVVHEPRAHGRLILAMVDDVLTELGTRLSALDAVAFGRGPGAFTGVRIGASVIQGLAYAVDLPVVPVSSLAALAHGMTSGDKGLVLAAFDARMGEVYWGAYDVLGNGQTRLLGAEQVATPDSVFIPEGDCMGAGSGWATYRAELSAHLGERLVAVDDSLMPVATDVLAIAQVQFEQQGGVAAEQALPVYLRNNVAAKPKRAPESY